MREAKEAVARKKDEVIQKFRIKWTHAEEKVAALQKELKEAKDRPVRIASFYCIVLIYR